MAFGFSRDDTGGFMPAYLENNYYLRSFASLDEGVCELVKMGIERGRKTKPDLKVESVVNMVESRNQFTFAME